MNGIWEIIAWISLFGLLIPFALYPLGMWLVLFFQRPREESTGNDRELPHVTILISAYNAAGEIEARIANALASNYPSDRFRILIVSDGSTDHTVEKVETMMEPRVRVLPLGIRMGKTKAIEAAMGHVQTEIVVFSDVSAKFTPDTLRRLATPFLDPQVGIASGELQMVSQAGRATEGVYWRMEAMVRRAEGSLGWLTGVSGAVYAMRCNHYTPASRPTINDDMVLPLLAASRARQQGRTCRFVQVPNALAIISSPLDSQIQLRRRRRISRGVWQAIPIILPALFHLGVPNALGFVGHKVLRWLGPLFLLGIGVSCWFLRDQAFFACMLALQVACYCAAFLGCYVDHPWLRLTTSFVQMHYGIACGFVAWCWNPNDVLWEPTTRPPIEMPSTEASHAV